MAIQQTLVLIKPDGLVKSLTGSIITALSHPTRKIVGAKIVSVKRELAEQHYNKLKEDKIKQHGEEKGTKIFEDTLKYVMGEYHTNRVMALVYEGENVVEEIRKVAGSTNPEEAHPESLRGKYGRIHSRTKVFENVIHASGNETEAEREIKLWFRPDELVNTLYQTESKKVTKTELFWK